MQGYIVIWPNGKIYLMTDTVNIRLKLESIKMDQGYFQDGTWINKSEMNYVGEITQINEGLAEHGIDLTG